MKAILITALTVLSCSLNAAEQDEHYVMAMDDIALLERLERPQEGQDYARCRNNDCYIMTTGERIGEGPDGIYLVWAIPTNN